MLDLDHFKRVNDTLGHEAGDRVLRALGKTLYATVRGGEVVGRYGGEEFVVVLGDHASADDVEAFLVRLRRAWEKNRPGPITFSAGIARAGSVPATALPAADRAMYRAKQAGRDRWTWALEHEYANEQPIAAATARAEPEYAFVAFSRLEVPDGGAEEVQRAFGDRLGAVDGWPGFGSLEVWVDLNDPNSYVMVSWWASPEAFQSYMRSADHRLSHDRIPKGPDRPRARQFQRFRIVAR